MSSTLFSIAALNSVSNPLLAPASIQADLLAGRPVSFVARLSAGQPEDPAARAFRTIPAQWLLDLLAANANTRKVTIPISVSNAVIDGPLAFRYSYFDCAVEFIGCEFVNGLIDFAFAKFAQAAKFTNCYFSFSAPDDDWPVIFRAIHASADFTIAGSHFSQGVDLSDIHVEEMLDASGSRFGKSTFRRMDVAKSADFSVDSKGRRTIFGNDTCFVGAHIRGSAEFGGALFSKKLICDDIHIEGNAYFCAEQVENGSPAAGRPLYRIEFQDEARFLGAHICGDAVFLGALFSGKASFDRLQVDGNAYFREDESEHKKEVEFCEDARFPLATFSSGLQFTKAHFLKGADFRYTQFHGAAYFNKVKFDGTVDFTSANAEADVQFNNSVFGQASSFREARFHVAFFANAPNGPSAGTGRPRHMILEDKTTFGGGVDLRGFTYERIYVDLSSLFDVITPFDRQPYNQLESTFRKTGADTLANRVYLKRRALERKRKFDRGLYPQWMADLFYKIIANYGVRPWWILFWGVATLFVGAWLFMQPNALDAKDPTRHAAPKPAAAFWPALGVSFHQFLPVDVPVGDYWVPASRPVSLPLLVSSLTVYPSVYSTIALRIFGTLLQALLIGQITGFLRRAAP
jgi:uncharacterized protein YjbI with pentapeptide repeats